ncbi:hypothetical protein [Comamonas sp. NoAH]|uniref:hypothetical protein n=1 Tax=Comamonas halotolerans TaxID=3041496 RepID=UPI0024E07BE2|nr:hypothetical protein [Comamonas sp. NoAH]
MNLNLTKMRLGVHRGLAALGLLAAIAGGSAHAGNVGISVGIHVPGVPVYVAPPPPPPPPRYYRPAPPPAVVYYPAPAAHGYWAPPPPPRGYGKHFKHRKHKHHPHHRHR